MSEPTHLSSGILAPTGESRPAPPATADLAATVQSTPQSGASTGTDYRDGLGSRRWNAAPLRNPEVEKTDPRIAVAAILILATITLVVLVAGYASGFWQLPSEEAVSGAVAALELLA